MLGRVGFHAEIPFEDMKYREILNIIDRKYHSLVLETISNIKNLPSECKVLGDDMVDVWEEFKVQVQGEHCIVWDLYEQMIQGECYRVLRDLPEDEIQLLWLQSEFFLRYYEENYDDNYIKGVPPFFVNDELISHVEDELYRRLTIKADDEPLLSEEPEFERDEANEDIYIRGYPRRSWHPYPALLYRQVLSIINDKYDRYVESIMGNLNESHSVNEGENGSGNTFSWVEVKRIIQNCRRLDDYYDVILDKCLTVVKELPETEIELLWLHSQGHFDSEKEQIPLNKKIEDIADELYSRLCDEVRKREF